MNRQSSDDALSRGAAPPGLFAQFARPSGPLGRVAGWLMARTDADDRWIVDLLDVQPDDRVLEIGFGPGVAIALLAARATAGIVVGVDPSDVMAQQAARRNRAAVRAGRVALAQGSATALPFGAAQFTKACAIHALYFWSPLDAALREAYRVLAPGGLLVLAGRTLRPHASRFDPSRYGLSDAQLGAIVAGLETAGFDDVTEQRRDLGRETIAALLARR
ncbi:MAG TPA: class I SAM-dependent methyltransferase [Chloroflexota bacterium]|nr:class I SAM-dependent methyltransferase [Chloroflexota bacterium]